MKLFSVFFSCILIQVFSACSLHADKVYFENLDTSLKVNSNKGVQDEKNNI